jgi:diaminopimelate decarboxylase
MIPPFSYKNNILHAEAVSLAEVAAAFGTPCYVYSQSALEANWHAFSHALQGIKHQICYAVKANAALAILRLFARQGAGFDIVSAGELERVLAAGGDPRRVIFSGVAKQTAEIRRALDAGIGCFNVESEPELARLSKLAAREKKVIDIALRVNPNIDAHTHPYIATGLNSNKFGIDSDLILPLCQSLQNNPYCRLTGIACHIGSQLTELSPFLAAIDQMLALAARIQARGIPLQHLDIGGGLGVRYQDETPPAIEEYAAAVREKFAGCPLEIIIEPGRALTANAGILLTRVEYLKHTPYKNFAIVDTGMNDLLRPALYGAWHPVLPIARRAAEEEKIYDIVGPVCESADFIGKDRQLALRPDDWLAIGMAGAYGACMSSNYNARPRAAEVMVHHDKARLIARRESVEDLMAREVNSAIER